LPALAPPDVSQKPAGILPPALRRADVNVILHVICSAPSEDPMPDIPDDIFTEPEDYSPDTLANLGPLRRLAGEWQSDQGVDINPKADGPERRVFREYIRMEPIDPQPNGPQLLYGLRYHIHINTPEEAITFHDQVGYWLWEPATGLIMQTIAIPHG